jgi:hypothetical protein
MSTPKTIFLDTNIFDKNQYIFSSTEFTALLTAFPEGTLTLLLPDPTSRELARHISDKAEEMIRALTKARKEAPFVLKLPLWPARKDQRSLADTIVKDTGAQMEAYLKKLNVHKLGYNDISFPEIMNWYDEQRAPFSAAKPKEFPDALAIAALLVYMRKSREHIAVISDDPDFKEACSGLVEVTYYPSITSYLDASLSSDARIEKLKSLGQKQGFPGLTRYVTEGFPELGFVHFEDDNADVQDIVAKEVEVDQIRILHVGEKECLFIVNATVRFTATVSMDDPDSMVHDSSEGIHFALHRLGGEVEDSGGVKVAVKCKISDDWSKIEEIVGFKFITDLIEVSERPGEVEEAGDEGEDGEENEFPLL